MSGHSVTLGGDRLGSGNKQKLWIKGFERSTHDLGYVWRSTMSAGTLVPFMKKVALPGDTWDIELNADVKTLPTLGPLFGSCKLQLDIFFCPFRLYIADLHNNKMGIGIAMENIQIPKVTLEVPNQRVGLTSVAAKAISEQQVNQSSLLAYLGVRSVGTLGNNNLIKINALPFWSYFDIFKNYYANKQETYAYQITRSGGINETLIGMNATNSFDTKTKKADTWTALSATSGTAHQFTLYGTKQAVSVFTPGTNISVPTLYIDLGQMNIQEIFLKDLFLSHYIEQFVIGGITYNAITYYNPTEIGSASSTDPIPYGRDITGYNNIAIKADANTINAVPMLVAVPLSVFDTYRDKLLKEDSAYYPEYNASTYTSSSSDPMKNALGQFSNEESHDRYGFNCSQGGLMLKTYQSDLFNNWINNELITGGAGVNDIARVSVTDDSFSIDAVVIANKIYKMLNNIAASGNTYYDWVNAVYDQRQIGVTEIPEYKGGLSKEIVFQEVVSNSSGISPLDGSPEPLGTLAGRGHLGSKHKGGHVRVSVSEPGYIMGIVSITPRVDYSQYFEWDMRELKTMNDLHKPDLDQIGFEDLVQGEYAGFSQVISNTGNVIQSALVGKQPAWQKYRTAINQTFGHFAERDNQMFMTFNRQYSWTGNGTAGTGNADFTTYINPLLFNNNFADASIDAQNFWVQIAVDAIARRKMSTRVIPNL